MKNMCAQKQFIFIDDSGDPGLNKVSSENFVMAAVVFSNAKEVEVASTEISKLRIRLGWGNKREFKFSKARKDIICDLLRISKTMEYEIYGVYLNKSDYEGIPPIVNGEKIYNWAIKELLLDMPLEEAKIEIDGRASRQYMLHTATYPRRE